MLEFDTVIGLEVHVQLKTNSKIFCACSTNFESPPNTNICPICCGYPGVLPVLNKKALELAIRVCLALNCKINKRIYFERKNYFYPDLPKNYQISQYALPIGEDGFLKISSTKTVKIKRIHLEEDAGKLIHKDTYSLVDFNRAGIPLLEIVTYPDLDNPDQAFEFLTQLKLFLQYIEASSCDMEKGLLRCDANISLKPKGSFVLGTKVELKNMNTFRGVKDALEYEVERQKSLLLKNENILQETRLWDQTKKKTFPMRTKEEAHDYRYFPEPDLKDFIVSQNLIEEQKKFITETPLQKKERFLKTYGLLEKEIDTIISDVWLANFFEEAVKFYPQPKEIANWFLGIFLQNLSDLHYNYNEVKISPHNFSTIVRYFCEGKINNLAVKKILSLSISTDKNVDQIINEEGLLQVSKVDELINFVNEAIEQNSKVVSDYFSGRKEALEFLVGQIMKKTKGKANPKMARELLEKSLKEKKNKI
ncbi:MAG: Asp-tRNA(Asn)/Glu-tRNA(Gln) amidotransferase subunit GatB [Candidatus Omnitrophica bacterium]|nr:Asp-tRNA(Asn)/Glu-tRNA(Gln) amidotransferase subunit GatB [Candidatus Omnitrophota bacterium]